MKTGIWEPPGQDPGQEPGSRVVLTEEMVRSLLTEIGEAGCCDDALPAFPDEFVQRYRGLMRLDGGAWRTAECLTDDELVTLIRFFTLAERDLSGWKAGKLNPVIPLVRILRSRGGFSSELRKWIKACTDNRYLPYGAVL